MNEETFDRLILKKTRGQVAGRAPLEEPHGMKEREEIENFLKKENRGFLRDESD